MTAKHTPGPWTPEFGEAYRVRAQQDGGQVAIMTNLKGRDGLAGRRNGDEVAANARLIAAAPELLEALRIAREFMSIASDWNFHEAEINGEMRSTYDWLEVVDTAIAKATGEQT